MAEAGGLTASIRQKLDAGTAPADVVQDLVAGGLSQASAERFVDRALAQHPAGPSWTPAPPTPPERPLDPDPSPSITDYLRAPAVVQEQQTQQAFKELTQGSLLMTGGILLTLVSLVFPAGGRIMIGLIAVGLWRFVRGVRHCARLDAGFPWKRVMIAIGIPLAVGPGILAVIIVAGSVQRARREEAGAAAALAAADKSRADEIRAQSLAARESANVERTGRADARLAMAVQQLSSKTSTTRCDAALVLGRSGSPAYVRPLMDILANDQSGFVRNCAAGALVSLGETDAPLAAYQAWIKGSDPDLRRSALMGFGDIGPSTADIALPYLTEEMKSPHADARYIAVEVLSKLGPAGETLLLIATTDAEQLVRDRAKQVLAKR